MDLMKTLESNTSLTDLSRLAVITLGDKKKLSEHPLIELNWINDVSSVLVFANKFWLTFINWYLFCWENLCYNNVTVHCSF